MKKILLSVAASAALSAGAVCADAPVANMSGAYMGLAAGIGNNYLDLSKTGNLGGDAYVGREKLGLSSAIFDLYMGYGKLWGNFYAGLEINGGFNTLLLKQTFFKLTGANVTYKYRSPWHAGASIRLGRSVFSSQALVYLGLGFQSEGHEFRIDGIPSTNGGFFRKNFTTTHFTPALGIEGMVTERMTLRFQVDYNIPVTKALMTPNFADNTAGSYRQKLKISSVVAKIGIGYKF